MESKNKTYRELPDYMYDLKVRLRKVNGVGRLTVSGERKEQVSVYLNQAKLSKYGLNEQLIATNLFAKGFVTSGGRNKLRSIFFLYIWINRIYHLRCMSADCIFRCQR